MKTFTFFRKFILIILFWCANSNAQSGFVDGSLDNTFNIGTGFNETVYTMTLQPDGKILVGGNFTNFNGNVRNRLVRLNPNGSLDNTFNIGSGFPNYYINAIAAQPDGKILVGGHFYEYNGEVRNHFIRILESGLLDTTFNVGTGFNDQIYSIAVQPDGKILVAGSFTTYKGQTRNRIIRLGPTGSIDNSFNIGTGFNAQVTSLILQNDGKILVSGIFTTYQTQNLNYIARLHTNGNLDTTFNIGEGFNGTVRDIAILPDNKIVAIGGFTSFNGNYANRIARLHSNGSFDTLFHTGSGFNSVPFTIAAQADGKILVGGPFTQYSSHPRNRLVRLYSTGAIDNSLNIGAGFDYNPMDMLLLPNGKILAGGSFTLYDGQTRNRILLLNNQNTLSTNEFNIANIKTYPNPINDVVNFVSAQTISKIEIYDVSGKLLKKSDHHEKSVSVNVSALSAGNYVAKVTTENGINSIKLIKK